MRGTSKKRSVRAVLTTVMAAVVLAAAAGVITGCGSTSSGGSSSGGSSAAGGGKSGPVSAAMLALAKQRTAKESQRPTSIGITAPLKHLPPKGLQVAMPSATSATFLTYIQRIKQAYGLMGYNIHVYPFTSSQDSIQSALSSADSSNPAGIVMNNLPLQFRQKLTAKWEAAGLPILANGSTDKDVHNMVNYINGDIVGVNTQQAVDWIVSHANGKKVNLLYVTDSTLPCCSTQAPYVQARLHQYCPTCEFHKMVIQLADVGTKVPADIVSFLQSHPEYNYGLFLLGDYAVGLPAALSSAGLSNSFQFCSTSGTQANYQYIKSGQQACDVSYDDAGAAYMGADMFARVAAHQSIAPDQKWRQAVQIITKNNLFWPISQAYPGVLNSVAQWKKLWGITS
jgi:ribose transport system substrate-binding protein